MMIEGPGGQTGSEGSRKRERRSKASVFGTLSVVVVKPASRLVEYILWLVVEIFTVDF